MIGLAVSLIVAALGTSLSYGESLLETMHRRYLGVVSAQLTVMQGAGEPIVVHRQWGTSSKSGETRVLRDANNNEIGTVTLVTRCSTAEAADVVAKELSRRIYSAASLTEPEPFAEPASRAPTAQAMIDDVLDQDATVITLAFHVTPPGMTTNSIVASSFGRIGKPADADDLRVIREGKTVQEITNHGNRVAVELPLLDSQKHVIGALSTSFRVGPQESADQIEKRAAALRDALSRRTPSIKALFRPATASRQVGALRSCHT